MQRFSVTLVLLLTVLIGSTSFAANPMSGAAEFRFLGYDVDENKVGIRYEVNFGGMVELRVRGENEEVIYRNQYINSPGEHTIFLKTRAFEPGVTYTFQLDYKRQTFTKEFRIP